MRKLKLVLMTLLISVQFHSRAAFSVHIPNPDMGVFVAMWGIAHIFQAGPPAESIKKVFGKYLGGLVNIAFGIILLDEETGKLGFGELTLEQASELGISETELQTYNAEVLDANIILEELSILDVEDQKFAWQELEQVISADTAKVMQKVAGQLVK